MTDATERLDTAATTRLDNSEQATVRLDAATAATSRLDAGNEATQRLAPNDDQATRRLDGAAPAAATLATTPNQGGEYFAVGQSLSLNGVDYRILSELNATSGEAITYVVEHGGQQLVLKHYRPGIHAQTALLEKIRSAPHEDIIRIHAYGTYNGQDFEIMDYARGGHLARFVRERGTLRDLDQLRRITREIANGLHHMHDTLGLIYQDLKPENILFLDAECTDIVLADFGISSLIQPGQREVIVKAHGTKEYAAPELTRFGNQTDTMVDAGVDYFALGITLLECWTGQRPFQGLPDALRLAQIRNKEVVFPADMDVQLATLIKGLLNPLPRERWGHKEVMRWVNGEALQVEYVATKRPYEQRSFNEQDTFSTPAELAQLLGRYPDKGQDYLYLGRIREWLDRANDMDLSTEIEKIERQFGKDDAHKQAGLLRAIYTLDPGRPFVSHGGRTCATGEAVGDAFLDEAAHYRQALANPLEPFYLYLQATGSSEVAANLLALFNSGLDATLAFNMALYELQGEGEERLKLGTTYYYLPEDFAQADDSARSALLAELQQNHARALVWLNKLGLIRQTQAITQTEAADLFTLLKLFPWLSYRSLFADAEQRQAGDAITLVTADRRDLLDIYVQQGLSLNAFDNRGYGPLHVAAARDQADIVNWLLDHGADINFQSRSGETALMWTSIYRTSQSQQTLIERHADLSRSNSNGATALSMACAVQTIGGSRYPVSTDIVGRLLAAGAAPDQPGAAGQLPLHLALHQAEDAPQALVLLELFLRHKANLAQNGSDVGSYGIAAYPALIAAMLAYEYVHKRDAAYLPVLDKLLDAGAKPNVLCEGKAALHLAASWDSDKLCQLLVAKGARKQQPSSDGELAANYARLRKAKALADSLDPGFAFRIQGFLWRSADIVARTFVLLTLFFSLSYLADGLSELELHGISLWITGFVLAHLTLGYALLARSGSWQRFVDRLRGTLCYVRGALSYVVFAPLLLPAALSAVNWLLLKVLPFAPVLTWPHILPAGSARLGGSHVMISMLLTVMMLAGLLAAQLRLSTRSITIHDVWSRYQQRKSI